MRARILSLPIAVISVFAACRPAPRLATDADTLAIRQLYREWPRSAEAGDATRYITFLDDSITLLIPGAPPIHGVAAYRDMLAPFFQQATYHVTLTPPHQLQVAGSWAFVQYEGQLTTLPKTGRDSSTAGNRYLDILRKQPDGKWRVYVHSWQNDAPAH